MMMTEFIQEKKAGKAHSERDIESFIRAYSRDEVPDYQAAAWLMAVCLKGMSVEETVSLTHSMVNSGQKLSWPQKTFLPADKHSTGGIGDKTSLIIAPLVASFGVPVPMMAGRGLGFTGGTLDKLESIPGFQTRRTLSHLENQMKDLGFFLVGQTEEICPADKRMYSLRDVTSTVDCLPLICASILSKKIAEGTKALVMDVKTGSGAFMSSVEQATELAQTLIDIGKVGGLKVMALVTDMNQPLGRFVGNSLEVKECLDILRGEFPKDEHKSYQDTLDLSVELSARMLFLSGYDENLDSCRKQCLQKIENGEAYQFFEKLVHAQGGKLKDFSCHTKEVHEVLAEKPGFLHFTSNRHVGQAALLLGGGRLQHTDDIDPQVGIEVLKKNGQSVKDGGPLFRIHLNDPDKKKAALTALSKAFEISASPVSSGSLIYKEFQ